MKYLKKLSISFLTLAMIIGSVFMGNNQNSYAQTSYKKLYEDVTYKYDLDGDGHCESVKVYVSHGDLVLKVNNSAKAIISPYCKEFQSDYTARIYDFKKGDKSSEIVFSIPYEDICETKILKYKNGVCKLYRTYKDTLLKGYNTKTGIVTFEEADWGRYNKFYQGIGSFMCYDKVQINGYNAYNQYTAKVTKNVRKNKYIASRTLTAYISTKGTKKAFTVKKGSSLHIYSLYQKGSRRYIKVKNAYGKYGYIKLSSTLMFTHDSCLWWR